jgi:hypothetical protein
MVQGMPKTPSSSKDRCLLTGVVISTRLSDAITAHQARMERVADGPIGRSDAVRDLLRRGLDAVGAEAVAKGECA